jgi:hypothetical protein
MVYSRRAMLLEAYRLGTHAALRCPAVSTPGADGEPSLPRSRTTDGEPWVLLHGLAPTAPSAMVDPIQHFRYLTTNEASTLSRQKATTG